MNSISLNFQHPMVLWLSIPVLAIILVPFLLLPAIRRKTVRRIVPVVLHCIMAMLLILILSGMSIVKVSDDQAVMILIDMSDSTSDIHEAIEAQAQEILDITDQDVETGVIAFADNCVYTVHISGDNHIEAEEILGDATDIEAALEYAMSMMPTDKARRIIVLSDGMETDGDAVSLAKHLATQGIRIDAMYFDTTNQDSDEVQISEFTIEEGSYVGDDVKLSVELKSNIDTSAELVLYDNEQRVKGLNIDVAEGNNLVEMTATADTAGGHNYYVKLESDVDTNQENNQAYAYLNVAGAPNILVIADTISNAELLSGILSEENQVDVAIAYRAPNSIVELCNYDEVILVNVDNDELPDDYDKLLETYVSVYGRSLLTIGGNNTYMSGNMAGTAFEEMLPVTLSMDDSSEDDVIALALVLDCSNSMSMTEMYLSVAKQGAIQCVEAMGDKDYVAVVSFNTVAQVQSPLIEANRDNKNYLTRLISGLTTAQGTYYVKALELAYDELEDFDAKVKHVIFLSDGNPSDDGYNRVVERMSADGITVSTIGLGYESDILAKLAEIGGGRYYYVADALNLPDIMLRETEQVATGMVMSGEYRPVVVKESALTDGLDIKQLPIINSYAGTNLKDDATAYIATEEGHPIYASWRYGAGTVATYTSSVASGWSDQWLNNQAGLSIIRAMVSTTVSDKHNDSSLDVDMTLRGKTVDITVVTTSGDGDITVNVDSQSGSELYSLSKAGTNTYKGSIDVDNIGVHEMVIAWTDQAGDIVDYLHTAVAISYSSEYDMFASGGKEYLESICKSTDGILAEDGKNLANINMDARKFTYNPWIWLGVIVAVMIIVDIAIRKIRWKDIKEYILRIRHK